MTKDLNKNFTKFNFNKSKKEFAVYSRFTLHSINNKEESLLFKNIKKSKKFMNEDERVLIISELKLVDNVFLSIDKNQSVELSIKELFNTYNKNYDFFFVNGGDQNNDSIPEVKICKKLGIKLIDGLGHKIQSSSWLLKK